MRTKLINEIDLRQTKCKNFKAEEEKSLDEIQKMVDDICEKDQIIVTEMAENEVSIEKLRDVNDTLNKIHNNYKRLSHRLLGILNGDEMENECQPDSNS